MMAVKSGSSRRTKREIKINKRNHIKNAHINQHKSSIACYPLDCIVHVQRFIKISFVWSRCEKSHQCAVAVAPVISVALSLPLPVSVAIIFTVEMYTAVSSWFAFVSFCSMIVSNDDFFSLSLPFIISFFVGIVHCECACYV